MNRLKNIISAGYGTRALYRSFLLLFSTLTFGLLAASSATAQTAPTAADFQRVVVAEALDLPMEFQISNDGRVFIISKCGKFYGWKLDGGVATQTATVPAVRCVFEDGAISIALDPNFTQNSYVYIQYTSPGSKTRVSRFNVTASNGLDYASEKIVLEWITGAEANGHMGGSLKFDKNGNLIITTGDNNAATGYFSAGAQGTSGNTNDLRGKVLRITPTADGKYTIPAGNLFPADATHRGEIYAMGFRNPFRLSVDSLTNYMYLGDVGPDASADSAEGPGGLDELNELRAPGNFGWPYIIGYNQPYAGYNATNITNNYASNTGAKTLPAAMPALWTIRHQATMAGPVYRFNSAVTNEFKLPQYYDGRLIFWDFNSSKFSTINLAATAKPPVPEDFPLNTAGFQGAIDAELDPRTNQIYVLQWGSGCCDHEPFNSGALYRFDYVGGRDNGPNLALGAVATASSSVNGNVAANVLDGSMTTRWETPASDPQTLNIDLKTASTIATLIIKWEAAYSSKYTIEGSVDGTKWDMLVNETKGSGGTDIRILNTTVAYRYLRLTGTARATAYGHSIYEFEVYGGKPASVPLTQYAYLNMPKTLDGSFTNVPKLLSQTGAFSNTANLTPAANLIPFAPNTALWSDRAEKKRWISLPASTKVKWDAKANWIYPEGTVAVKHFDLPVDAKNPATTKRLETRLIVTKADGTVYGVTYKWRADNSDADLLTTSATQNFTVTNADNTTTTQTWTYPSPTDCLSCHNAQSSQILGLSTRQLNGNYTYPNGTTENQLVHWNNLNLFTPALNNAQVGTYDKMVAISDTSASLETRVKSYLDTNCAHCHGTGNGASQWDARFNTPLSQMKIVDMATTGIRDYLADYGISNAKVVASGNPTQSVLYIRDKSVNPNDRMPPIGRALEHTEYISVLNQWIAGLSTSQPPQKVLLSGGKPVTASSVEGNLAAANVVDADTTTTRWGSAFSDPQWIEIDLQAPYNISEVMLVWEAAYGKAYTIQGSLDHTTWTTIVTQNAGTGGMEIFDKVSGYFRYIKLTGTVRGTAYGYSLFDFEVWGSNGIATPTPTISITSPTSGQQFNQGTAVNFQVSVSDSAWFSGGGSYKYTLDSNAAVAMTNANAVTIPAPAVGAHTLKAQLYNASGTAVGTAANTSFTVNQTSSTPVLISQGKTATSSAITGANGPGNAFDGNMNTRWESAFADNQYIQVDLGTKMNITEVILDWEGAYGKAYNVQVSDNGTQWTQIYTTATGDGGQDDLKITGQGRYVRLNCVTRATQWGFSLWEFRVFGTPITGTPTPTISITSPTAGAQYTVGTNVSLQVAVSDAAWFTSGGSYTYSLNGAAAVKVTNANAVNLGALAVNNYTVQVTLQNAQNQVVGTAASASFSVKSTGGTSTTPSPAKLTPAVATASSVQGANTAAAAADGNTTTRWESAAADPQYLQYDMGKSMYFTKVVLNWEAAYAKAYTIDVSEDGNTWTNAYTTTASIGGIETLTLDGPKGRYIRMRGTVRATGYGYSLFEFEVYGLAADTNPVLISFASPAADAVLDKTASVSLQVSITDAAWITNGGAYNYYLDSNAAVKVTTLNAVNLGLLPTGPHNLKVSLVDKNGAEVSVPKVRKFRVSCGTSCPSVLIFSKTAGFRHDSIPAGIAMVQKIAADNGYTVVASEDSTLFTTANLAKYSTIVFMNTTGDIFDVNQRAAFQAYIENGGGWVGTHSAADTEHNWPWYTGTLLAGGEFKDHHDGIPRAKIIIEKPTNVLVNHIGASWTLSDEWYYWKNSPRGVGNVEVLGNLDSTSFTSSEPPVVDHPVIYTNQIGRGRTFYTAIGHVDANFSDPNMTEMIRKAIEWTSNK